jgi:endonuclease/exonuclease/phosphatase family metal-dependent hydrolase
MAIRSTVRHIAWLSLAAALVCLAGCGQPAETPTGPHFTVLTYNVNWSMPGGAQSAAAIERADADIVCLQETTPEWEQLLREHLGQRYPHVQFRHWRGAGGQAVLSKLPFRELNYLRPRAAWFPGWIVQADTPAGPVQVLNVHLRPPLSERGQVSLEAYLSTWQVRRQEIEELFAELDPNQPAIILGDFNEAQNAPAVSWLRRRGFEDALAQFDPHAQTWRWSTGLVTLRARFDHVLYCPHLHCLDARVLTWGASDHFPVVARLQARTSAGDGSH